MRRWTFISLIVLFGLIAGAATWQILLASRDQRPYRGPLPGSPLPVSAAP